MQKKVLLGFIVFATALVFFIFCVYIIRRILLKLEFSSNLFGVFIMLLLGFLLAIYLIWLCILILSGRSHIAIRHVNGLFAFFLYCALSESLQIVLNLILQEHRKFFTTVAILFSIIMAFLYYRLSTEWIQRKFMKRSD